MPRFYFNLDGVPSAPADFETVLDARNDALRYLTKVVAENPTEFWSDGILCLTVTDERGSILCTLRLVGSEARNAP